MKVLFKVGTRVSVDWRGHEGWNSTDNSSNRNTPQIQLYEVLRWRANKLIVKPLSPGRTKDEAFFRPASFHEYYTNGRLSII